MTEGDPTRDDENLGWVEDIRRGKFESLPDPLDWDQAIGFVYLLNGYDILETEKLATFANRKLQAAEKDGDWTGNAIDLWLCLFAENRRWRHLGGWPAGRDLALLNQLCRALREALVGLDQDQRQAFVRLIENHPCPWN